VCVKEKRLRFFGKMGVVVLLGDMRGSFPNEFRIECVRDKMSPGERTV